MPEQEVRADDMTVFTVHPEGEGPFPVAVVFMDAPGYREELKEHARRYAADGYYAVLPDLFHRAGEKLTMDGEGRERIFELVRSLTPEMVDEDTRAALEAVADDPAASPGPKVCVGYCMGARFAVHTAAAMPEEFAAASGAHPALSPRTSRTHPISSCRRCAASCTSPSPSTTARPRRSPSIVSATPWQTPACAARSSGCRERSTGSRWPTGTSTTETRRSGTSSGRSTSGDVTSSPCRRIVPLLPRR